MNNKNRDESIPKYYRFSMPIPIPEIDSRFRARALIPTFYISLVKTL